MGYTLDDKLVIGIASSALFDLGESDRVYREQGIEAYRAYQREHEGEILGEGVAFPFVRRLLALNPSSQERLVEVVLLSRNDPDTGLRVFNSIEAHGLDISRGGFLGGREPFRFMESFRCALFLSNHEPDVREAIARGYPAGLVVDTSGGDDRDDDELRIAFDFDGVIVDDEAETVFQTDGVEGFHAHESARAGFAHNPGPCKELLERIAMLQRRLGPGSKLRVSIVTSRDAPAHKRVITTLREWGIRVDEMLLLGGVSKQDFLEELRPHIFFDDQERHLAGAVPSVHVPFGRLNQRNSIDNVTPLPSKRNAASSHDGGPKRPRASREKP